MDRHYARMSPTDFHDCGQHHVPCSQRLADTLGLDRSSVTLLDVLNYLAEEGVGIHAVASNADYICVLLNHLLVYDSDAISMLFLLAPTLGLSISPLRAINSILSSDYPIVVKTYTSHIGPSKGKRRILDFHVERPLGR